MSSPDEFLVSITQNRSSCRIIGHTWLFYYKMAMKTYRDRRIPPPQLKSLQANPLLGSDAPYFLAT